MRLLAVSTYSLHLRGAVGNWYPLRGSTRACNAGLYRDTPRCASPAIKRIWAGYHDVVEQIPFWTSSITKGADGFVGRWGFATAIDGILVVCIGNDTSDECKCKESRGLHVV